MGTNTANNTIGSSSHSALILVIAICFSLLTGHSASAQECTLAYQLKNDPVIRSDYLSVIEYWQKPRPDTSEEMYENIETINYIDDESTSFRPKIENRILDPISMECITCHDGTLASSVHFRVSTVDDSGKLYLDTITASHPVGGDYSKFARRRDYSPVYDMPGNMVFMNGKISCITCHDMLNSNQVYLTVDMAGSNLCFTCHRK